MNLPEIKIIDTSASRRGIETKGGSVRHYPQHPVNFFDEKFSHLNLPADLSRLRRSRVPNLARAGTLELAKWDNSFAKLHCGATFPAANSVGIKVKIIKATDRNMIPLLD
jgi:hypothetical protein